MLEMTNENEMENEMTSTVINGEMRIPLPEGFHVMSDEERLALSKGQNAPAWVMSNEEKHLLFSVSWKAIPAIASMLLGPKDMVKNNGRSCTMVGLYFG